MKFFLVAMLLYPNVQQKAQDELDSVIGRDRLPTFEDRPRLPFIDAMCKEVLRWRLVTPLGAFNSLSYEASEWHLIYNILADSCPARRHERRRLCWLFHTEGWALFFELRCLMFAYAYFSGAVIIANSW